VAYGGCRHRKNDAINFFISMHFLFNIAVSLLAWKVGTEKSSSDLIKDSVLHQCVKIVGHGIQTTNASAILCTHYWKW